MRGINEAIEEIKAEDKNSAITAHFLRKLIKSDTIPYVRAGAKYLVNMDILEQYLQNPAPQKNEAQSGIRKVKE